MRSVIKLHSFFSWVKDARCSEKEVGKAKFLILKRKLAKIVKNNEKVVIVTSVAAVIALVLDAFMFVQHGHSLTSSSVWPRLLLFIILAVVVNGLSFLKMRFCGYATILVNLYFAIASLAAFQMVSPRESAYGLFIQALSIVGILVGAAGIYYGAKQRTDYTKAKFEKMKEQMKK